MKNYIKAAVVGLVLGAVSTVAEAYVTYTYECRNCGYSKTYTSVPWITPRCPNDGWTMTRVP